MKRPRLLSICLLFIVLALAALAPAERTAASPVFLSPGPFERQAEDAPPARTTWQRLDVMPTVRLFVLPGTAASRDADRIAAEVRRSLRRVQARLQMETVPQLEVYLVERVFWQGGAAYEEGRILVTYTDRNYTAIPLWAYLDHEITHALSRELVPNGGQTNTLLSEGLATWTTGGHYGLEPVHEMAAAVARSPAYVPLADLLTDFRAAQHEIAYIEAASFVGWIIERWGLETFKRLYGHATTPHLVLGRTYDELEQEWLRWLSAQPVSPFTVRWFDLQIRAFETMRRYQETFDPFARILPDSPAKWDAELIGEYRENPDTPTHVALETLLKDVQEDIRCGHLSSAERRLAELQASIEAQAVVGPEAEAREAAAARLIRAAAPLETARFNNFSAVDPLHLFWQRRVGRPVQQEIADIATAPGSARAAALVWWFDEEGETSLPVRVVLTQDGSEWHITNIQIRTGGNTLCTAWPTAFTTSPVFGW